MRRLPRATPKEFLGDSCVGVSSTGRATILVVLVSSHCELFFGFSDCLVTLFPRQVFGKHWSICGFSQPTSIGTKSVSTRFTSTRREEHHRDFSRIFRVWCEGDNSTFSGLNAADC